MKTRIIGSDADFSAEWIQQQLSSAAHGRSYRKGDSYWICCPDPDHPGERTPSCKVNLTATETYLAGSHKCFGCGKFGQWNSLAKLLGLPLINEKEMAAVHKATATRKADELICFTVEDFLEKTNIVGFERWPRAQRSRRSIFADGWRGITNEMMYALDAHVMMDRTEIKAFFPVIVNEQVVGGVRAVLEPDGISRKYLTTPGSWVNSYGLFPYDVVSAMNRSYVVAVEGPRDAMRLIRDGIPAVAMLGSQALSKQKIKLLSAINPFCERVFGLGDGDAAGRKMLDALEVACDAHDIPYTSIILPETDGDNTEVDPFNMSERLLQRVMRSITRRVPSATFEPLSETV